MDRILVRDLAARTVIGLRPAERAKRQDVVVNLALEVEAGAGRSDSIADTVDYKRVKDDVLAYVESSRHRLLETLAEGIATTCLRHHAVRAVGVTVDKPGALRFARSVAVEIHRDRPPAAKAARRRP